MNQADPYLWLEAVEGESSELGSKPEQVELSALRSRSALQPISESAVDLPNAKDRILYGAVRGGVIYNFWQDETNVRGLWRKTTA